MVCRIGIPAKSIAGSSFEEDAALIAALVRGTKGAERCFADRHDAFLRSVVLSSSPHAGTFVDDLTHEVYVHLWGHGFYVLRRWQRKAPLRTYLRSIVRRLVWERLGELRPRPELLESDPMSGFELEHALELPATAEELLAACETLEHVQRALECLNATYRQVIELRYYRDLSYRDMAELLGITPSNAGVRLARALAHLKPLLIELLEPPERGSTVRPKRGRRRSPS